MTFGLKTQSTRALTLDEITTRTRPHPSLAIVLLPFPLASSASLPLTSPSASAIPLGKIVSPDHLRVPASNGPFAGSSLGLPSSAHGRASPSSQMQANGDRLPPHRG